MKQLNLLSPAVVLFLTLSLMLLASCSDGGSGPSKEEEKGFNATIAAWPQNAVAAYSLIADDYCGGLKGQLHADTMMANRGMGMAFGAMVNMCKPENWQDAREKIARGHEIVNHSWNHPCFTDIEECGSGPVIGEDQYDLQLGMSTTTIQEQTGARPTFMVFPFDCATDSSLDYLKHIGYLGARMGFKQKLNENSFDPFRPNFDVNWPADGKEFQRWNLNEMIDAVLEQGEGWAIREMHGVDDGWGPVTFAEMQQHANYLKSKVDAGQLWVAPPSEVILYHNLRNSYVVETSVRRDTVLTDLEQSVETVFVVDFVAGQLKSEQYSSPLTLLLTELPSLEEGQVWNISQPGEEGWMPYDATDPLLVNANPKLGSLELRIGAKAMGAPAVR